MEDSSWAGWTTPPGPPAASLAWPVGSRVESAPGRQADRSLSAEVRRALTAYIGEPLAALEQGK